MATEYIVLDRQLAMSVTPESPYGTLVETAANLRGIVSTDMGGVMAPMIEKLDDRGKLGNGNEFATQARNNYWAQATCTLADDLNFGAHAYLTRRAAGGTVTTTTVATGVYDHEFGLQPASAGRQLPGTTLWDALPGGERWGTPGFVTNTLTLTQEGANPPRLAFEMRGLGNHKRLDDVTPALTLPVAPTETYAFGADVAVSFDDGSPLNISDRIRNINFTLQNNLREEDRRPGDPARTTGDYRSGAYAPRLLRGNRECMFELTVFADDQLREYAAMRDNTLIEDLTYLARGPLIDATHYHEFEIVIPRAVVVEASRGGEDDVTRTVRFMPLKVAGQDYVRFRIRNTMDTLA